MSEKQHKRLRRLILLTQDGSEVAIENLRAFVRAFDVQPRVLARAFELTKAKAERRLGAV